MNQTEFYPSATTGCNVTNCVVINCNMTEPDIAYEIQYHAYESICWWVENVAQGIIGIAGILANTVAIPVLCSKDMYGIFNRLLIFLAIFDNVFIICQILEAKRKLTNTFGYFEFDQLHEHVFGYFLYPVHAFVLTSSIYITVALALERYRAVWRPVEYHNKYKGVNPWKRIIKSYVAPVIAFSMAFTIPKFFELEFLPEMLDTSMPNGTIVFNGTEYYNPFISETNVTMAKPTEFRLNDIYVLLYCNIARILVQGIIPFISLSFLNYRIYWVIKRRRELKNRPRLGSTIDIEYNVPNRPRPNSNIANEVHLLTVEENPVCRASFSAERKANEAKHAVILFIIVLLFFICHTPRVIINIHELVYLDLLKRGMENDCDKYPILAFIFTSISNFLLTVNSSSNFYIYCFMCSTFRNVLYDWILDIRNFVHNLTCFKSCTLHKKDDNRDNLSVIYDVVENKENGDNVGNSSLKTKCTHVKTLVEAPKITFNYPDIIITANNDDLPPNSLSMPAEML